MTPRGAQEALQRLQETPKGRPGAARSTPGGPKRTPEGQLGSCVLNMERSRAVLAPPERPWRPHNYVKYTVFNVFYVTPQGLSRGSKEASRSRMAPRGAQERPRRRF